MATEKERILETALSEMRLTYARLNNSHTQVKNKILIVLGGGLALLSFLYGGGDLFIPKEVYGRIFYFAGLALVLSSISVLIKCIKGMFWHVPTESGFSTMVDDHDTKESLLSYLTEEYSKSLGSNIPKYERKLAQLDFAFYQLILGGILLLVLKNFGG